MKRKVCVVTGTRAEFGLLRLLMGEIKASNQLELQVVVTGTHLAPEYGSTYLEITDSGFNIDEQVEMLLSGDTSTSVAKSLGLGVIGFADTFVRLDPDVILLLGDRFEILAAANAALITGFPIAHIHGGELTEGAFDEAIRHSVSKMSHLHFVAADEYRNRVIQLGEQPDNVFNFGGLGVDAILRLKLLTLEELEKSLDFELGEKNLLITFHPITLEGGVSSADQMIELLDALHELKNTQLIFTMPNSDTGSRKMAGILEKFVEEHSNAIAYKSLGQLRYLSCMKWVDGVIGNSSSGIAEAPSLGVGTVNIGSRQKGRLQAESVIDCKAEKGAISAAIEMLYSEKFKCSLKSATSPYGSGGASKKITYVLENCELDEIKKKTFYDIPIPLTDKRQT